MATKFQGRFYLIDNCLTDLKCWVYEFEPMTDGKRSSEDWAESHIQESYSAKDLRELFDLPVEGDFQVLFTAEIDGKMSYGVDGDDYNEWLDVIEYSYQPVPTEYATYFVCKETTDGQSQHQGTKSTVQGYYQGEQAILSPVTSKLCPADFVFPPKGQRVCTECGGTSLDHPCSAKSRNTDDDTCPRCKGSKLEPTQVEPNDTNPIEHSPDFQARVDQAQSDYLTAKRRIANEPD